MRTTDSGHSANSVVVPGHRDKYALVERERRFLMAGLPSGGGASARRVDIVDRYLTGTRLRLRRIGSPGSPEPELKLTQKVPAAQPGPVRGLITNLYLSPAEYDVLATLPGAELAKTRLFFPPYAVDVFGPPRGGLVLAEVELDSDADLAACPPPPGSLAEVTCDDRFTGGRLAVTPRAELLGWLAEFGLAVPGD
jgi:CYTH domain-containing protein